MTTQRRSDQVRARRGDRYGNSASRKRSKSGASSTRRDMPPMVSRYGMSAPTNVRTPKSRQKEARRRIDVALPITGAEMRLPSGIIPRLNWRAASFVIMAVLGFAFYWLWTSPQFTITTDKVVINGLQRVEAEDLLAIADITDKPVFTLDPHALEETLTAEAPALESLKVSVGLNGDVIFDVVERVPVIAWNQQTIERIWWVDQNGLRFPAIGTSEGLVYVRADAPPPTPTTVDLQSVQTAEVSTEILETATGQETGAAPLLEEGLVDSILFIAPYVPEGSELIYDQTHGLGWQDPVDNWQIFFGKELDQMNVRMRIYEQITSLFAEKKSKPVMISVEYIHAPYYRMEP